MRLPTCVAVCVLLFSAAAPAAVDCFEGNQAVAEERLDDAIEMFQAALSLPACHTDRPGLQLNLAVALSRRAGSAGDHCRAADLFEAVTRATTGAARERVLVPWRIEQHRCAVARALDVDDARAAVGELRGFVASTAPDADPQMQRAHEGAERQLASLRATRVGEVSIQCPVGGQVNIDGLEGARACPARWQDVPIGTHRVGWIDARGAMRSEVVRVQPGRVNAYVFAPAAATPPQTTVPPTTVPQTTAPEIAAPSRPPAVAASTTPAAPSNTTAWVLTIGAAALVVGGGVTLLAALDAESEREQARADIIAAQAPPQDRAADADAQARYADAQSRTLALGYAGYGAVALGAVLGAAAIWLWTDDAAPSVAVTPDGAALGFEVRF